MQAAMCRSVVSNQLTEELPQRLKYYCFLSYSSASQFPIFLNLHV
jgi:hypothetical protein